MLARNVDWHVSRRPIESLQQNARFGAGAAAELDQPAVRADLRRALRRVRFEDRDLGAGRVILRQAADRLEQGRAARVVEEFAKDPLGSTAETLEHGIAKALLTGRQIMKAKMGAADHPRSSASRNPAKAQRA